MSVFKRVWFLCFFAPVLILISCKKDNQNYVDTLLTASPWVLASAEVHRYTGSTEDPVIILNTKCGLKQTFNFKPDGSCTYENFICRQGTATGTWQFSDDRLILQSSLTAKDTTNAGRDTTAMPFKNARITNLGSNSLVLEIGDTNVYFTSTTKRVIRRFGFIHE